MTLTAQVHTALQALQKAVGSVSEPVTYEVEAGHIRRFAEAIGDPNPLFTDEAAARRTRYGGMVAPPTFLRAFPPNPLPVPDFPLARRLDGGSEWEYHEPIRPGDRITVVQRLADVRLREGRLGPMLFIIRDIIYTNQFGQVVATQRATGIAY
ncbi:MAG: MaoC family dehydratase N-terminal domain-containing protein [Dehalococcoidia bacterium]|nr:MaoC family dehydratase N-terminal domain-containing protein [Dehalococcoidia bacterium]MDW8119942.1 MaoC family dehydratase N-terminal domain-containing protein [Chloroflexota bacterium]